MVSKEVLFFERAIYEFANFARAKNYSEYFRTCATFYSEHNKYSAKIQRIFTHLFSILVSLANEEIPEAHKYANRIFG